MGITIWRIIAAIPALVFSLWTWLAMWAFAPGYASATVTLIWAVVLAAAPTRAGQNALMWLIPARAPNPIEQPALADPIARMHQTAPATALLGVRIVAMPGIAAAGTGQHNIVITRDAVHALQAGRLPADQTTALLVSAAGQILRGATRAQWPLTVLTLPWLPFRVLLEAFMIIFGRSLPIRFALKVRGLYAIAALIQTTAEGHPLIGIGVLTVIAATYWQPYAARRVTRCQTKAGDHYAADAGHGAALARLLSDLHPDPGVLERLHHLTRLRSGLSTVTS